MDDLAMLKIAYNTYRQMGDEYRTQMLDGIVAQCHHLQLPKRQALLILALVRGFLPMPGDSFDSYTPSDTFDNDYTEKVLQTYDQVSSK
jgi:hypothetical protein